jgi:hypothetical protein
MLNNIQNLVLNNPYALYPGSWPLCGYRSPIYNTELIRLIHALKSLQDIKTITLFHLTCGSPIEEFKYTDLKHRGRLHQKYQLIPDHLYDTAKKGISTINFIVSPNKLDPPLIIKNNNFTKINDFSYVHNMYPLHIYIFNTMMPSNNKTKIDNKIKKLLKHNILQNYPSLDINTLYQTKDDVKFIDIFYQTLRTTINNFLNIGSFCSCFSFAVFNQDTEYYKYNRCALFRELIEYYPATNNSILYEWVYNLDICNVYSIHNIHKSICYVPSNEFKYDKKQMNNAELLRIDIKNNRLVGIYIPFIGKKKIKINTDNIIDILTKKNLIYNDITYCNCETNKIMNDDNHYPTKCNCYGCKTHIKRSAIYKLKCNDKYKLKCKNHDIKCINHPHVQNYIYDLVICGERINYNVLDDILNTLI